MSAKNRKLILDSLIVFSFKFGYRVSTFEFELQFLGPIRAGPSWVEKYKAGMAKAGEQGGRTPTQILAE